MSVSPHVVIIGAGIVGCGLADELTERGLDRRHGRRPGPALRRRWFELARPRPRLPDQRVEDDDRVRPLHRREVQRSRRSTGSGASSRSAAWRSPPPRSGWPTCTAATGWADLLGHREPGDRAATSASALSPLLDRGRVLGGFHVPTDGLAKARPRRRGAGPAGDRARAPGSLASTRSPASEPTAAASGPSSPTGASSRPTSSSRAPGSGDRGSARWSGWPSPLLPLAHQYIRTTRVPALAAIAAPALLEDRPADPAPPGPRSVLPRARRPDRHRLLRPPADAGRPVRRCSRRARRRSCPRCCEFTPDDFAESLGAGPRAACRRSRDAVDRGGHQRHLLVHPRRVPAHGRVEGRGRVLGGRGGLGHPFGGCRPGDGRVAGRRPAGRDVHECDVNRFEPHSSARRTSRRAAARTSSRSTTSSIRSSRWRPRARSGSARSTPAQVALGAHSSKAAGWERPHWYEANGALLERYDVPGRNPWATRYWSPIAGAEALATRESVGALRHDLAQAAVGHGTRRARAALQRPDHQRSRPAGRERRLHPPARRGRRHPQRPDDRPARRRTSSRSAPTATSTSTGSTATCPTTTRSGSPTSPPAPAASASGARARGSSSSR